MTDTVEAEAVEPAVPAGDRGATRISERVVAKLAVQAAREALRAEARGPVAPRLHGELPHATAVVTRSPGAEGGTGVAGVQVAVALGYPSDIGAQCGAVRRHVTRRIKELTGMEASYVAVSVERLYSAHFNGEATGRVR
ncbi:Asp23/Gls24 family envelope stress response protein [Streptomyces sp. PT12]|uniref:Asp23/Gls24 family envelope stress response protein n=1 Tax=Streptomyces sp. PT12 TaxID=1510197 RepID=UPI000DE36224|nr:Asp23/Gls24 family envelope stress response protein [Streptomyces sp. PT12]RBM17029.1 hypothetical protein DEH69_15645 [Streptomyces sp. PT12]